MYPNKHQCLLKETKSSRFKVVIGILTITMMIAVGLSILGVWGSYEGKNDVQSDDYKTSFVPENKPLDDIKSENKISEIKSSEGNLLESENSIVKIEKSEDTSSESVLSGSGDVSVAQKSVGWFGPYTTEPGEIEIIDANLPPEDWEVPLCLTTDDVDDYSITVAVKGGYTPENFHQKITVWQPKEWNLGWIDITWTEVDCPEELDDCCWDCYVGTFSICGEICLESNQLPDVGPDFYTVPDNKELLKDVWFRYDGCWSGCPLPCQYFSIILAHKSLSQNPLLSMRDTSPVSD